MRIRCAWRCTCQTVLANKICEHSRLTHSSASMTNGGGRIARPFGKPMRGLRRMACGPRVCGYFYATDPSLLIAATRQAIASESDMAEIVNLRRFRKQKATRRARRNRGREPPQARDDRGREEAEGKRSARWPSAGWRGTASSTTTREQALGHHRRPPHLDLARSALLGGACRDRRRPRQERCGAGRRDRPQTAGRHQPLGGPQDVRARLVSAAGATAANISAA